ncbi:MAG: hypothetical protein ACR2K5_09430 [Pseudolabrys sp.]
MMIRRKLQLAALSAVAFASCAAPSLAASDQGPNGDLSAQRRPRITIYPPSRLLGPNAKRECEAWLEKEYRVSGTVIVPRERCWWR